MPTWNKISETTVSGSSTTSIDLTSIPQTYTDLAVALVAKSDGDTSYAEVDCHIEFYNGSTAFSLGGGFLGIDYSLAPNSQQYASRTDVPDKITDSGASGTPNTGTGAYWLYIHDYSSTTLAKNAFIFTGKTTSVASNANHAGLKWWRICLNTSSNHAIDRIKFGALGNSDNFIAGSFVSIYGITS
tara:strand:+ start:2380 stop:2937 length:558 start_codon:yes stop_codon:yes gene_type:complete